MGMGSYDVNDITNKPNAIVDTSIAKGLKVISIADHNEIMNIMAAAPLQRPYTGDSTPIFSLYSYHYSSSPNYSLSLPMKLPVKFICKLYKNVIFVCVGGRSPLIKVLSTIGLNPKYPSVLLFKRLRGEMLSFFP